MLQVENTDVCKCRKSKLKCHQKKPVLSLSASFYSSPYSLAPNRMLAQTSLSPYMHSPVSSYQVRLCLVLS